MKSLPQAFAIAIAMFALLPHSAQVRADASPVAGVRELYSGTLRPDVEVETLRHADRLFPVRTVHRGPTVRPLPAGRQQLDNIRFTAAGKAYDLFDYLALNRVTGLLILKAGEVAFEDYELGNVAASHWASFSMAKSVASTLVGAAVRDGLISSLDDSLVRYLPQLVGGGYDGVTVRQILQMASGVRWDETYTDPNSDRRKLLDLQITQRPGAVLGYMAQLPRAATPGSVWNYNTGETFVVGALLEAATHRPLAQYLSEKIWAPAGMESDATWWLDSPNGMGLAGSGLNATLRDYGRLGLLVLNDGILDGKQIVPAGWFKDAASPKMIGGKPVDYGYLWWPLPKGDPIHEGAFLAEGIFGQFLYINPREKLVIVVLSARPKPTGTDVIEDAVVFGAVAKALHGP